MRFPWKYRSTRFLQFKTTNIKFYIVETATPRDNQLHCKISHLNRKVFLFLRSHKPQRLKENLKHPEPPQPDVTVVTTSRLNSRVNITNKITHILTFQSQLTRKDITQLIVTIVTKRTIQLKKACQKPRRLVVTIATTTRKWWKGVFTPQKEKEIPQKPIWPVAQLQPIRQEIHTI